MGKFLIISLLFCVVGYLYWLYDEVNNIEDDYPFK
jgi:hypothetical protein